MTELGSISILRPPSDSRERRNHQKRTTDFGISGFTDSNTKPHHLTAQLRDSAITGRRTQLPQLKDSRQQQTPTTRNRPRQEDKHGPRRQDRQAPRRTDKTDKDHEKTNAIRLLQKRACFATFWPPRFRALMAVPCQTNVLHLSSLLSQA